MFVAFDDGPFLRVLVNPCLEHVDAGRVVEDVERDVVVFEGVACAGDGGVVADDDARDLVEGDEA